MALPQNIQQPMADKRAWPCPACGHVVFKEPPGSYDICPICYWEDDGMQLASPMSCCGANSVSLHEAQRNFALHGAVEKRFAVNVRRAGPDDRRDSNWQPFDPSRHSSGEPGSRNERECQQRASARASPYYWLPEQGLQASLTIEPQAAAARTNIRVERILRLLGRLFLLGW
jgi:hypothetical protein